MGGRGASSGVGASKGIGKGEGFAIKANGKTSTFCVTDADVLINLETGKVLNVDKKAMLNAAKKKGVLVKTFNRKELDKYLKEKSEKRAEFRKALELGIKLEGVGQGGRRKLVYK